MFQQVPDLPVVVPIAGAAFLGLLWSSWRRGRLSLPRAAVAAALCTYVAGIVANTVFPIFVDKPAGDGPWSDHVNVLPVAGYDVADAALNVAVFVPLGVLVTLVLARPSWRRVLAVCAAVSLGIEVVQFTTATTLGGGHVADVNDLLSNGVGGLLGFGLLALGDRSPAVRTVVDRFRWQRSAPVG